jgi:hypothetical protein
MMLAAQAYDSYDPERPIGVLAVLAILVFGAFRLILWIVRTPHQPEPWDEETSRQIESEDAMPLCLRCLTEHGGVADFCPNCGAPVGAYNNFSPYFCLFSIGHALRTGAEGKFRRSPFTIIGFLFFGLMEYSVFFPLYCIRFFRNLPGRRTASIPESAADSSDTPAGQ